MGYLLVVRSDRPHRRVARKRTLQCVRASVATRDNRSGRCAITAKFISIRISRIIKIIELRGENGIQSEVLKSLDEETVPEIRN